jgi:hypothetical protein
MRRGAGGRPDSEVQLPAANFASVDHIYKPSSPLSDGCITSKQIAFADQCDGREIPWRTLYGHLAGEPALIAIRWPSVPQQRIAVLEALFFFLCHQPREPTLP